MGLSIVATTDYSLYISWPWLHTPDFSDLQTSLPNCLNPEDWTLQVRPWIINSALQFALQFRGKEPGKNLHKYTGSSTLHR
jgi:hypothetical protein